MGEDRVSEVLSAIEKQGERSERLIRDQMQAIQGLASEIRDFGQHISEALSSKGTLVQSSNGNNTWPILFGVGALMFGLMSPAYVMVRDQSEAIYKIDATTLPTLPVLRRACTGTRLGMANRAQTRRPGWSFVSMATGTRSSMATCAI